MPQIASQALKSFLVGKLSDPDDRAIAGISFEIHCDRVVLDCSEGAQYLHVHGITARLFTLWLPLGCPSTLEFRVRGERLRELTAEFVLDPRNRRAFDRP